MQGSVGENTTYPVAYEALMRYLMDVHSKVNELLSQPFFVMGLILQVVLSIVSISMNLLLAAVLPRVVVLHRNAMVLLMSLSIGCIALGFSSAAKAAHLITNGYILHDYINLQSSPLFCVALESPVFIVSMFSIITTLVAIGFERWHATRRAATYAESNRCRLGCCGVVAVWISSVVFWLLLVQATARTPRGTEPYMAICNAFVAPPSDVTSYFIVFFLLVEVSAIVLYCWVLRKNRVILDQFARNQAQFCLSMRLQLRRNVQVTNMLLMSTVCHGAVFTALLIAALAIGHPFATSDGVYAESSISRQIIAHWHCYVLPIVHSCLHPALCIWKNPSIRKHVERLFGKNANAAAASDVDVAEQDGIPLTTFERKYSYEQNRHFEILYELWGRNKE